MEQCKYCRAEVSSELTFCNVCNYPINGTEKEQSSFIAKQITQKQDVQQAFERIKRSRIVLFVIGAFYIVVPFTPLMMINTVFEFFITFGLGIIFVGFGLLTYKMPLMATGIPLALIVVYYLILLMINPMYLVSGILWKIAIIIGLGVGFFGVKKANKILKENKYLASQLEIKKI